ncbi:unnamed protein product [Caenorhabditis nigoni]
MKLLALCFIVLLACSINTASARICGMNLYKVLFNVCPSGCSIEDPSFASKLCAFSFSKEEIKEMCCPTE